MLCCMDWGGSGGSSGYPGGRNRGNAIPHSQMYPNSGPETVGGKCVEFRKN